jgi:hypothetical protein
MYSREKRRNPQRKRGKKRKAHPLIRRRARTDSASR